MRRIFASGVRAGFVLSFRWIQSELNYSDKGSRCFDRDDPSMSLLHVLAQRLTRFSPAPACDKNCLSPSLIHLDVGEVDFNHMHHPMISLIARDMLRLSHLKVPPLLGEMIATEVVSSSYGSADVVCPTSWVGWIVASRQIADSVVVIWEWYRSSPRTESH